ncbi:hypothetical protein [Brumicola nitratireducens]|uniref:Uncharacterized protein n=1 Tax=Glaciecola nitratireducens (strain JCM 12485 / KCTC 12276 / FR1064) TaxID=1085623 RepID=G4QG10_GLANF|nr:hypothetical protein [Glaciecola nitratireducens]AEP29101.1 hypothetical protein GNIT_0963 [Glaciecola nitratireducens FR1064]
MLKPKDFYRLDEVEEHFSLTKSEILDLAENRKLQFSVRCVDKKGIVFSIKDKRRIGLCHATYNGCLAIGAENTRTLSIEGKVEFSIGAILETSKLNIYSSEYQLGSKMPNRIFAEWNPSQSLNDTITYGFVFEPSLQDTKQGVIDVIAASVESFTSKQPLITEEGNVLLSIMEKSKDVFSKTEKFELHHSRVAHQDLVKLGHTHISSRVFKNKKSPSELVSINHPPHILIKNLIQLQPLMIPSELWKFLQNNWESRDDLDPNSILCEVTNDYIRWMGKNDLEKKLSYKSFKNRVIEFKKIN